MKKEKPYSIDNFSTFDAFEMVEVLLAGDITEDRINHAYDLSQTRTRQAFDEFMSGGQ